MLQPAHAQPPSEPTRPLRLLVVDDERPARANVVRLVAQDPRFIVVGEARDGLEALARIEQLQPEVVVLDVQMPGLDGFEMLESIGDEARFCVLFVTASDAHALRAFDTHAVDYLLKPYDGARFQRALDKAYAQRLGAWPSAERGALLRNTDTGRARLAVRTIEGSWVRLDYEDILRVSAANKYSCLLTRAGSHMVRQPLRELAARLDDRFVRVHRSDLVNVQAVVRVEPWDHGDALLRLSDGSSLVLTRTFRRAFQARFARS